MPEEIKPVNQKGYITPIVPDYTSSLGTSNETPLDPYSLMSQRLDAAQKPAGTYFTNVSANVLPGTGRYGKIFPGEDMEEMYAKGQGWGSKMVNDLGKGLSLTGTTLLQSTVGLVNGLIQWGVDGRAASFYDNEFNRKLDAYNKQLEDTLPNYYTAAEKNANWYSPEKLFSANFLWDGIVKNMGFAAGAALSGGIMAAGLKALPLTAKLFSVGKAAEALAATEEGLLAADKVAETYGKIKGLSDKFLSSYKTLNAGGRALVGGLATTGEAGFEAYNNLNQFRDEKIQEYKDTHGGRAPIGDDLNKINQMADSVGNSSFLLNTALLSATNYIQFPKILGSSYKAEKSVINGLTKEIGEITTDAAGNIVAKAPTTGFGKLLSVANKIRPYTFSASEAFEEGAQYAIQVGTQDYYNKKYKGDATRGFIDSLSEGVSKTLGTNEGAENILIGGLSGSLMQARGTFREQREESKNTAEAVAAFNKFKLSDFTKETIDSVNRGVVLQQEREQTLKNGDVLESKDKETDYIINYLAPRIKFGRMDLVTSDIQDLRALASSDEGFAQLKSEGKALETDTQQAYLQRLTGLENTANNIKSLYESLNIRYGGMMSKDGKSLLYSPAVMDKMVYAATKIADYDKRVPEVGSKVALAKDIDINTIVEDVADKNFESYDKAMSIIESLDKKLNADQITDLKQSLQDVAELTLRRQKFLQEYNDMKKTPENFTDIAPASKPTSNDTPGETIEVKGKTKKRNLEIGKEYLVGNPTEFDKDKNAVSRPSRVKIVAENTDGTIKIQIDGGETKDVAKDYLLDHNLVKIDTNDKLSNFLSANLNSRFLHKGIKDKTGKAVEGTIKWDDVNNTLVFQYANDKGTLIGVPIKSSLFQASKGYKTGVIERIGEATAEQKATLDNLADTVLTAGDIREFLFDRKKIVADLVTKSNTRLDEVNKQLEKGKARLNEIREGIEKAHLTKKGTPRKNPNEAVKIVKALSAEKIALEKSLDILQEEKESLDGNVPYLQSILDDIDSMPEGFEDARASLKKDINDLENIIESTKDSIKTNESLLNDVNKLYEKALDILNDWIRRVKEENPNIPITTQDLEDKLERFYGPEGARRLMEERGALAEDLITLQEQIDLFSEELKIPDLSKKIDGILEDLDGLDKQLDDLINQQITKADLLKVFENAVREYEDQVKQEKQLVSNEKFVNKILATNDNTSQRNLETDEKTYKPDRIKPEHLVPLSTVASVDIPGYERSVTFGMNLESFENRDQIRGVYVTSKNEEQFGLKGLMEHLANGKDKLPEDDPEYIDPKNTIAFVMVEKGTDGVLRLVDQEGKLLEEGVSAIDNAIYQVMPTEKLKYGPRGGNRSMLEDSSDNAKKVIPQKYKAWRDSILAEPSTTDYEVDASFGTPQFVGNLDDKGKFERNYDAVVPVEKAGLVTTKNLAQGNVLTIPTTDADIFLGSTRYKNALGRVFLTLNNAYVRLTNRNFSKEKAETIYQAIERLADNFFASTDKDTEELSAERVRLQKWLKSVIYWGTPKDIKGKRKEAGYNSIWYEKVKTDDPIFKTQLRLFFGKNEESLSFTPNQIRANKEQIIDLLQKLYPNANSTMVKGGRGVNWNDSYEEILSIDKDGTITSREWKNYQSYLLSDKFIAADKNNPENGKSREDVPFFTQIRPKENKNDVNRDNIYFSRKAIGDEFSVPVEKAKTKAKKIKGTGSTIVKTITAGGPTVEKKVAPVKKAAPVKKTEAGKYDLKGKEVNTFTTKGGNTFDFIAIGDKLVGKPSIEKLFETKAIQLMNTENNKKSVKAVTDLYEGDKKKATKKIFETIYNELVPSIKEFEKEQEDDFVGPMMYSVEQDEFDERDLSRVFGKKTQTQENEDEDESPFMEDTAEDEEEEEPTVRKELEKRLKSKSRGKSNLRKILKQRLENFKSEDWKKFEEWMKANFPNIPVYRVKNIIQGMGGSQGYGMFHKGAIYLLENAELGSGYHEVFHPIWQTFTTPKERQAIAKEFRNREGSFFDSITEETIQYKDANIDQIEEQLAEEFRDYILEGKIPVKPKDNRPFILRMFSDLISYIRKFLTGKDAKTNTEQLFEKIGTGAFKDSYSPYASELAYANKGILEVDEIYGDESSKMRKKFTGQNIHDIMQQMTYETLRGIVADNDSLSRIANYNREDKVNLYKRLKLDVEDTTLESARIAKEMLEEEGDQLSEKDKDSLKKEIARSIQLWRNVRDNWNELISKHEEYLRSYSIQFDENDQLQITDETNTGREDYQDSRKMDNFRKMNSAIKLLLATLPIVDENNDIEASSIGGVKLLPMSEVYIKIMNNVYKSRTPDEMIDRLHKMAQDDLNYRRLFTRLTGSANFDVNDVTFSNLDSTHQLQLIGSFYRTFKKQNPDVKNVYIFENGDVEIGDSNFATAARQVMGEYENNIRKIIKSGKNPYFEYSDEKKAYVGKQGASRKIELTSTKKQVEFLKNLGIEFKESEIENLSKNRRKVFNDAVSGIKTSIANADRIATINAKVLDINNKLLALSLVRAQINNPEFDSTFFNVTGERMQAFIGPNAASELDDMLSQIDSLNELKGTRFEYLLTDSFAQGSYTLGKMFDLESEGKERIKDSEQLMVPGYADGMVDVGNGKRKPSDKLNYRERIIQQVNLNLKGFFLTLIPGDSATEHMEYMGNAVSESDIATGFTKLHRIFKNYLISEINLSRDDRPIKEVKGRKTTDLRFFKGILSEDLHNKIVNDTETDPEEIYNNNSKEIDAAVENFIKKQGLEFKKTLLTYSIIQPGDREGTLNIDSLDFAKDKNVAETDINRHMTALAANFMIANIEMHKLLFSDPYQYSDELKRIKNFLSPGQAIVHDSPNMNAAYSRVYNEGYEEGEIGWTNWERDYFKAATMEDVWAIDEVLKYSPYEEANGSGIISQVAHRNFRIRAGEWNDAEELQFRYDIAWEKDDKKKKLSDEEKELLKKGNPEVRSAYTPVKPIARGNKGNGRSYNDVLLDKFALYPLSYRVMKQLNSDANILKLYDKMQRDDVDYVVFESGRKVGAEKLTPVYNSKGEFNNKPFQTKAEQKNPDLPQAVINVPFSIFYIQTEVPSKDDGDATRGSQTTKLVTMDYMEAGVPIDFKHNDSTEFTPERYEEWVKLSPEQKEEQSPLYKEIMNNQKLLEEITEEGYQSLLKKLGITEVLNDAGETEFEIEDFSRMAEVLRDEILKREVNVNISAALNDFLNGNTTIEATPAYQQIRNILYSIADKNVISTKINGGMKVQITSTMLESVRATPKVITTKDGEKKTVFTSDVLKFYRNKDGKRVCQIYLARWFDSEKTDKELLNEWYTTNNEGERVLTEEGKKILSGLGFRIPTQRQNSIDSFEIAGFLPREFGDSVVIPSQLVEKAGSDFDIDKLTVYLKNVYRDINNNVKHIDFLGYGEQAKEQFGKIFDQILEKRKAKAEIALDYKTKLLEQINLVFSGNTSKRIIKKIMEQQGDRINQFLNTLSDSNNIEEAVETLGDIVAKVQKKVTTLSDADIQAARKESFIDNMYKKSLQNAYIQSCINLVSNQSNFENLTKPNSAKQLKDLAAKITKKLGFESFDYSSTKNLLSMNFMSRLRHAFVSGKYAIGIAATAQTNHSQNQRGLTYIDVNNFDKLSDEDKFWITGGTSDPKDMIIRFEKYNKVTLNGEEVATLSMIKNADDQYISDLISQFIDGYVDISKGPWIMELGSTSNVAGTWLFLVKMGVPIEDVAYFMNQPIIREYLRSLENSGYSWLFIDDLVEKAKASYTTNLRELNKVTTIPTGDDLFESIGKTKFTPKEAAEQHFMLDEFLKYAKMANQLFLLQQGTNYDTANLNDPLLINKKEMALEKATKTIFTSTEGVLGKNSFVTKIRENLLKLRKAFSKVLMSDQPNVRSIIQEALMPYIDLPDREFLKIGRTAIANLFDYAVQTDRKFNQDIKDILLSDKNVADEIQKLADRSKLRSHPLHNNPVMKAISTSENDRSGVKNIKIKNRDNKTYDQNQLIYGFNELKDYLISINREPLYNRLVQLAVLQSGLTNSPISFTSLLPYVDFKSVYSETLSKLDSIKNLATFNQLNVFQRNNWADDDIVPRRKAQLKFFENEAGKPVPYYNSNMRFSKYPSVQKAIDNGDISQVLRLDIRSREAYSDTLVYSWEDETISLADRKKMKREGDYSFINKGLFQKVKQGDSYLTIKDAFGNPQYVYKMINAWGDSFRANEFYTVGKKSVIDNGFLKVDEVSDAVIIQHFPSIFKEKVVSSQPKRTGSTVTKTISTAPVIATPDQAEYLKSQIAELENTLKTKGLGPEYMKTLTELRKQLGKIIKSKC